VKSLPSRIGNLLDIPLKDLEKVLYCEAYIVIDPKNSGLSGRELLTEERYGKLLERTITGFEGKPASGFALSRYDGSPVSTEKLAGTALKSFLTNCVRDARTACTADRASLQRLNFEERGSYVRKCVAVAFGN
jgi:DNA-directed RNA polymerase beta' subunit